MSVTRAGPCLPTGAICSQRFAYDWDEVGHLARARRWDTATPGAATSALPTATPNADLRYFYDVNDARTLKTAIDSTGTAAYSAYVFPSLELRRTTFASSDYSRTSGTEVAYLAVHGVRLARLHYSAPPATPTESGSSLHVLLDMLDHLGSTAITLDRDTSEVVETDAYQASGAADSDYRPARWNSFREDYRFTGKEEDVEVGLQYFGKRFYAPSLNRWVSPDPMTMHAMGADTNVYAYVHGKLLAATDKVGLAEGEPMSAAPAAAPVASSCETADAPLMTPMSNDGVASATPPARAESAEAPPSSEKAEVAPLMGEVLGGGHVHNVAPGHSLGDQRHPAAEPESAGERAERAETAEKVSQGGDAFEALGDATEHEGAANGGKLVSAAGQAYLLVHGLKTNNSAQAGKAAVNLTIGVASTLVKDTVVGFAIGLVTMQPDNGSQIIPWCSIYGQEEPPPAPESPGIVETLVTQSHQFFGLPPPY